MYKRRYNCQNVSKCCVPVSTMAEISKAESDVDTADEKNACAYFCLYATHSFSLNCSWSFMHLASESFSEL